MKTVLRAESATDFLALLPTLAGCEPRNSVVFVPFVGNRSAGVFRIDLPRRAGPAETQALVRLAVGLLSRIRSVDSAVPVIYSDNVWGAKKNPPHAVLLNRLVTGLEQAGFEIRDALIVAADGWCSQKLTDSVRRNLAEIRESALAQKLAHEPIEQGPDITQLARRVKLEPGARREIREALSRWRARDISADGRWANAVDAFLERFVARDGPPTADDHARLIWMIQDDDARDAALLKWAFNIPALGATDSGARGDHPGAASLLLGLSSLRPDREGMLHVLTALRVSVSAAPRELRPNLYSTLAWTAWSFGWGSPAAAFCREALAIEPHHEMALAMNHLLSEGRLPEWVFSAE